jgi:hypothetical protein
MKWLVFSYSLPTKGGSSSRVTLWRRLQNLGALDLTGVYVLPQNTETLEAFTWLSQEVQTAGGEGVVMQVESFSGLTDKDIIEKFNGERAKGYQTLIEEINLYPKTSSQLGLSERSKALAKLRRQFADITRLDFFSSRMKGQVAHMLTHLEQSLKTPSPVIQIKLVKREDYQNKIWVTRPQPYVDRLASIWFIRRFIDKKAVIRYRGEAKRPDKIKSHDKAKRHDKIKLNEVSFDMMRATFGHTGTLCTFETMLVAFGLNGKTLDKLADIVHELDLQTYYTHPETSGIEAVLKGWQKQGLADKELETRGISLFEGLYQALEEKI